MIPGSVLVQALPPGSGPSSCCFQSWSCTRERRWAPRVFTLVLGAGAGRGTWYSTSLPTEALRYPLKQRRGVACSAVQHRECSICAHLVQGDGRPATKGEPPSPSPPELYPFCTHSVRISERYPIFPWAQTPSLAQL